MKQEVGHSHETDPVEHSEVERLYLELLDSWNTRRADAFARLFSESGNTVGFDGSPLNGRAEIASVIGRIFADHKTARYVGKIREIRLLTPKTAVLRAIAGMVSPGQGDLNPDVNAVQTLVANRSPEGKWMIELFQSTPAQFHGRPELSRQLTEELRELL